jgi:hypothetical protein
VLALNEVEAEVAHVDWSEHGQALVARGPFDLVLAADVLYTRANVDAALELFPQLGAELRMADPNRAGTARFLAAFDADTRHGEPVSLHTIRFADRAAGHPRHWRGPPA